MNKISISTLKNIIKECVQEVVNEVAPPGKKSERMVQHVKKSLRDKHPNWSEDKITQVAIATAWKAHNKENVEEAAYKVVSPTQADTAKENKALKIQTEPKVTENHKVQTRSAKTIKDVSQDPKNVRDPKVPQT